MSSFLLHDILPLLLPFLVAVVAAGAIRLAGGSDTGARLAGVGLPAGFLAGWVWSQGFSWSPQGLFGLTSHIALGGALLGLVLDAADASPRLRRLGAVAFLAACVWASLGRPTHIPSSWEQGGAALALLAAWGMTLWRLDLHHPPARSAEGLLLLTVLAAGLAATAAAAGLASASEAASALALAAAGLAVLAWPLRMPFGAAAALGGGGALLGVMQAMVMALPGLTVSVLVLGLGLFAGRTAQRLPGPERLRPLTTALLAALPGTLAALTALAVRPS